MRVVCLDLVEFEWSVIVRSLGAWPLDSDCQGSNHSSAFFVRWLRRSIYALFGAYPNL